MSDTTNETTRSIEEPGEGQSDAMTPAVIERAELVDEGGAEQASGGGEQIEQPAKVMRVGAMMRQLLEQVREIDLDEPSRERMRDIYEQSITELGSALSPDLHDELLRLSLPFSDVATPSESELAVARLNWLVGSKAWSKAFRQPCSLNRWRPSSNWRRSAAGYQQGNPQRANNPKTFQANTCRAVQNLRCRSEPPGICI